MTNQILTGGAAKATCTRILAAADFKTMPRVKGYFTNELARFTAFDNTTGDCFVEDFKTAERAVKWLSKGE